MATLSVQQGMTLVELMIALTLGLVLSAAAGTVFVQGKMSYLQNEQLSRLQENGRYAIKIVARDLAMAGFLAELPSRGAITSDPSAVINSNCTTQSPMLAFTGANGGVLAVADSETDVATTDFGCIAASEYKAGTDAVAIKRTADAHRLREVVVASECSVGDNCCYIQASPVPSGCGLTSDVIYIRTNGTVALVHRGGSITAPQPPPPRSDWAYKPRVYFVRTFTDSAGDGIPNLCRKELIDDPDVADANKMETQCLAEGVEDLQILIGVDTSIPCDRVPDFYTSTPTADQMNRAVTAQVHVLARSVATLPNTDNQKTYTLGNVTRGPFNDRFARRVYSTTVQMRNTTPLGTCPPPAAPPPPPPPPPP